MLQDFRDTLYLHAGVSLRPQVTLWEAAAVQRRCSAHRPPPAPTGTASVGGSVSRSVVRRMAAGRFVDTDGEGPTTLNGEYGLRRSRPASGETRAVLNTNTTIRMQPALT